MTRIKKAQSMFSFVAILSECSHIFCCVLPTMFSVLSVLVGLGLIGAIPVWLDEVHHIMHAWEIPIMLTSGLVVSLGWALYFFSRQIECRNDHCMSGGCASQKKNNLLILKIATGLFFLNIVVYMTFHDGYKNLSMSIIGTAEDHVH